MNDGGSRALSSLRRLPHGLDPDHPVQGNASVRLRRQHDQSVGRVVWRRAAQHDRPWRRSHGLGGAGEWLPGECLQGQDDQGLESVDGSTQDHSCWPHE